MGHRISYRQYKYIGHLFVYPIPAGVARKHGLSGLSVRQDGGLVDPLAHLPPQNVGCSINPVSTSCTAYYHVTKKHHPQVRF